MNTDPLRSILERMDQLSEEHKYESLRSLLDEAIRVARSEKNFGQYCHVLSIASSSAYATELIQQQFDWSMEAITLLEAIENAQRIDPELDEGEFEYLRQEFIPDSYHRLALATAKKQGYNSIGMQEMVAEGIHKCHEVGAREDIKYFQEYALDISIAADDLEFAAKQAIQLTQRSKTESDDRRSVGWEALGRIRLLMGDLEGALHAFQEGMLSSVDSHDPRDIGTALHKFIEMTYLLLGRGDEYTDYCKSAPVFKPMIISEHKRYSLLVEEVEACRACLAGDYKTAKKLRQKAIDFADKTKALAPWFRARVQWLALALLEDPKAEVQAVHDETERLAKKQRDWLTLRQLACLKDPDYTVNPIVSIQSFLHGPYASTNAKEKRKKSTPPSLEALLSVASPESQEPDPVPQDAAEKQPPSGIERFVLGWEQKLTGNDGETDELVQEMTDELLDMPLDSIESERDAEHYLRLVLRGIEVNSAARKLWHFTKKLKEKHQESGFILALVADIADVFQRSDAPESHKPSVLEVEQLFDAALNLDIFNVQAYFSAGTFFARRQNTVKAERCFARAFRLDRTLSPAVLSLCRIYKVTGRMSDALEVVDLSIRHGSVDEEVLWEAGLLSFQLECWQRCVTYFKRLLEIQENAPYARYYSAVAHCHLGQFQDGLNAMDTELARNEEAMFVGFSVKSWALLNLDRGEEARKELGAAQKYPLSGVQSLSPRGLRKALFRLWRVAGELDDEGSSEHFLSKMFRHGLIDDELLDTLESGNEREIEQGLDLWDVVLEQALPENWSEDPDCLPWEQGWKSYQVSWVIMAPHEESAKALALGIQSRCAETPATVLAITQVSEQGFTGKAAVLQAGPRDPARTIAS